MEPRPLLVVLAAVFAGLSTLLAVAAVVTGTWMVLMAAVPLALTAGLMWYQGTGRLTAGLVGGGSRRRRRRRRADARAAAGGASTTRQRAQADDQWEDPFRTEARREARTRARRKARQRARRQQATERGRASTASGSRDRGASTAGARSDRTTSTAGGRGGTAGRRRRRDVGDVGSGGLTAAEAYDVLDIDGPAGEDAIREAYREKAKVLHPDTEGGSAEAFQELNAAYERLVGD